MSDFPTYPPDRSAAESLAFWNREFNVDFKKLFGSLVKLATGATLERWDQVAAAAADAVTCFRADLAPEGLYWLLVQRSLHAATHGLIAQSPVSYVIMGSPEADEIAAEFDRLFVERRAEIPPHFLDRPADLDVLQEFQAVLLRWLVANEVPEPSARSLADLLPTAFIYEIRREWDRRATEYGRLKAFLEGPFARAEGVERAWLAHPARLEREAREPVFLEAFGLRDLYVGSRACYECDDPADKGGNPKYHTPKKLRRHVDLHEHLGEWAAGCAPEHVLQFVSGDPGSGKSSFTRIFAADQAATGRRVLRIPLHEYRAEARLEEAVCDFAPWEDRGLGSSLKAPGEPRDLLLIFDGLDELAQADKVGAELAVAFVREVRDWVREARREKRPVQVLITGRTPVVQTVVADLRDVCRPLELLPLGPPWPGGPELVDAEQLADLREEWWRRYAALTQAPEPEMPERLLEGDLAAFTQQPLLCILVARWWRKPENRGDTSPVNRNQVLVQLLKDVFDGSHNRRQHPAVRDLEFRDYLRILEEIALVVAQHGGRIAPLAGVRQHLERTPEIEQLLQGNVAEALDEGLFRLLAAFYFRRGEAGRKEAGSLEFTHKQFGEYLVACRLVRAIEDVHDGLTRRKAPLSAPKALAEWTGLFGRFYLTVETLAFVRDELRLPRAEGEPPLAEWCQSLARMLHSSMHDGIPLTGFVPCETHREIVEQGLAADTALLAAADGCMRARNLDPDDREGWCLPLPFAPNNDRSLLRRWLFPLLEAPGAAMIRSSLRHVSLTGAHLALASLCGADLYLISLEGVNLNGAHLEGANLGGAHLESANLEGAHLEGANLRGANLEGAHLLSAHLEGAFLEGANLEGAHLEGANLRGAHLMGAHLGRAHLYNADLRGANLYGAYLRAAYLRGAYLRGAYLDGAHLEGAYLNTAQYDARTRWPGGFDPRAAGAVLLE